MEANELFDKYMKEYNSQLKKGFIQKAYKELMNYMMGLRNYFRNKYSDGFVVGSFYQGYMDITFFTFTPDSIMDKKLKIAILFNHEKSRFESWLVGQNKQIQKDYQTQLKINGYKISDNPQDSVIENIIVENPDFSEPGFLTQQIGSNVITFVRNIESQLRNK